MSPTLLAVSFALAVIAAFIAGVVFHKFVVSEATAIKDHVSDEIAEVRLDVTGEITKLRDAVSGALSKTAAKL